jgi:hypothetical protein
MHQVGTWAGTRRERRGSNWSVKSKTTDWSPFTWDGWKAALRLVLVLNEANKGSNVMRIKLVSYVIGVALLSATSTAVLAWDPIGDITNPGRIINNVGREIGNAGQEIDRIRIEAQAQAAAPAFEQGLIQSRNSAASGGVAAIPPQIRQQLTGFYDDDILNRARFKVGDSGVANFANLSIQYGDAAAVTLIDIVVFKDANDAYNNAKLWAHELKHVQQFRDWGTRDFSIRYLRSWNSVEGDAHAAENSFVAWRNQIQQAGPVVIAGNWQPPPPPPPQAARICATPYGSCPMAIAIPVGSQCNCQGPYGVFWGIGQP